MPLEQLPSDETQALRELGDLLRAAAYPRSFTEQGSGTDPLAPLCMAQITQESGPSFRDLFCRLRAIPLSAARQLFGPVLLERLFQDQILFQREKMVGSRFAVVAVLGYLLLIEPPAISDTGDAMLQHDYLTTFSLRLAAFVREQRASGRALDLGSGTGIQSLVLSESALSVVASDIDRVCCASTLRNLALNDRSAVVVLSNLFDDVKGAFDTIVMNPPWRLVPTDVDYPSRTARVGRGRDGLDLVREVIAGLPDALTPGGSAFLVLEAPGTEEACPFIDELTLKAKHWQFAVIVRRGPLLATDFVAARSIKACGHLNAKYSFEALKTRFLQAYSAIEATGVWPLLLRIQRSTGSSLVIEPESGK